MEDQEQLDSEFLKQLRRRYSRELNSLPQDVFRWPIGIDDREDRSLDLSGLFGSILSSERPLRVLTAKSGDEPDAKKPPLFEPSKNLVGRAVKQILIGILTLSFLIIFTFWLFGSTSEQALSVGIVFGLIAAIAACAGVAILYANLTSPSSTRSGPLWTGQIDSSDIIQLSASDKAKSPSPNNQRSTQGRKFQPGGSGTIAPPPSRHDALLSSWPSGLIASRAKRMDEMQKRIADLEAALEKVKAAQQHLTAAPSSTQTIEGCDHWRQLLNTHIKVIRELELQAAAQGSEFHYSKKIELEERHKRVAELEQRIAQNC
jgi:hypothetical protein